MPSLVLMVLFSKLFFPTELINEQFAQIGKGMKMEQVKKLLGESNDDSNKRRVFAPIPKSSTGEWGIQWSYYGVWWRPYLTIYLTTQLSKDPNIDSESKVWIGKSHALLARFEDDTVTATYILPVERSGGGVQGCIDTVKFFWAKCCNP